MPISNSDLESICHFFKPQVIQKKDFLLTQGNICKFEGLPILL